MSFTSFNQSYWFLVTALIDLNNGTWLRLLMQDLIVHYLMTKNLRVFGASVGKTNRSDAYL